MKSEQLKRWWNRLAPVIGVLILAYYLYGRYNEAVANGELPAEIGPAGVAGMLLALAAAGFGLYAVQMMLNAIVRSFTKDE